MWPSRAYKGVFFLILLGYAPVFSAGDGIGARGVTGGLVIPGASVLPDQTIVVAFGNYSEPAFADKTYQRNLLFGFGIFDFAEIYGRFADYNNSPHGTYLNSGPRDLSANIKLRLPIIPERWPQVAVGWTDVGGGNSIFQTEYGVVSHSWRSVSGSLGYLQRLASQYEAGYQGLFGGVEWNIQALGLSMMAEHDGQTLYAGGRWISPPLESFSDIQLGASLQHSLGASYPAGGDADALSGSVQLLWPVGNLEARRKNFTASARRTSAGSKRPDPDGAGTASIEPDTTPVSATAPRAVDPLTRLRLRLEAAGLERVRVGTRGDSAHLEVIVEYENHRYAWNEVDAIGLALGIGADTLVAAQTLRVVTLKDGLKIYETRVNSGTYREFLKGGSNALVKNSLIWQRGNSGSDENTTWEREAPTKATWLRFEVRPDLHKTVGTEFGAFDYSLAAEPRVTAPLWKGGRATLSYSLPLAHSLNMENGRAFEEQRHQEGLETMALGQSFWLGNRLLVNTAAGRFHFTSWGAQGEAQVFTPVFADVIRLGGALYTTAPGVLEGADRVGAVSYRRIWSAAHWTEIGWQLYGDRSAGPTFEWTRWASDIGTTLFVRQGGQSRFAGIKMTVPLTPRRGMQPHFATLAGLSRHSESLRSMVQNEVNYVQPASVRELRLEADPDQALFDGGRMNEKYLKSQVYRMREAYFRYAAPNL